MLAVDIVEPEKGLQELQRRAMLTGAATAACVERVFHLVLESLPKPEFMGLLGIVRGSMAELFTMANALPETVTHVISSDAGSNGQGMEDVTADGYDDGGGESQIDRDEAVDRLGALL